MTEKNPTDYVYLASSAHFVCFGMWVQPFAATQTNSWSQSVLRAVAVTLSYPSDAAIDQKRNLTLHKET